MADTDDPRTRWVGGVRLDLHRAAVKVAEFSPTFSHLRIVRRDLLQNQCELLQEGQQDSLSVERRPPVVNKRRGDLAEFSRRVTKRVVDIQADADDEHSRGSRTGLDQDPAGFPPLHKQIVGPLEADGGLRQELTDRFRNR